VEKTNFTTFGPPLEKFWKNLLAGGPPGKNPSDAYGHSVAKFQDEHGFTREEPVYFATKSRNTCCNKLK